MSSQFLVAVASLNVLLHAIAPSVGFAAGQSSDLEIQPLQSCQTPTRVFLGHETSESDNAKLRAQISAKGHLPVFTADLLYRNKALKRDDVIYSMDQSNMIAVGGEQTKSLKFPMTLKAFNTAVPHDEATDADSNIVNEAQLKQMMKRLAELDKKRQANQLTKEEKAITLSSLMDGIFKSDDELSKMNITIAVMFGPRKAITYHPEEFALEEGYGDDSQNMMTGFSITGTEMKRRVLEGLSLKDKTIGELGSNHVMTDAGIFAISLVQAITGGDISEAESMKLTEQFISALPNCK